MKDFGHCLCGDRECPRCFAQCEECDNLGYIEKCDADGSNESRVTCPECGGWEPEENPRERGDDDGVEYADPPR